MRPTGVSPGDELRRARIVGVALGALTCVFGLTRVALAAPGSGAEAPPQEPDDASDWLVGESDTPDHRERVEPDDPLETPAPPSDSTTSHVVSPEQDEDVRRARKRQQSTTT